MNRPIPVSMLLLGLWLPLMATAGGEDATAPQTALDPVVVQAPRLVLHREDGQRVWRNEQTAQVRYDDLDLTRADDRIELEDRVAEAADQVCRDLADLHPDATPRLPECVRRAIEGAMVEVDRVSDRALAAADIDEPIDID